MIRGKVRDFNLDKGYGTISSKNNPDVVVHFASIEGDGFKYLIPGEKVEFEITGKPPYRRAINVKKLSKPKGKIPRLMMYGKK